MKSPRVTKIAWGIIEVEGLGAGKDVKLFPGGARDWDWNETGTRHVPGIQPSDVQELLDQGAEVIVLSRGMLLRLQICTETMELLETAGIEVHEMETKMAVVTYNHFAEQGIKVGGLFHSTC